MALPVARAVIRPEWIDANGHMNLAYYVVVFDQAIDAVFEALDIGIIYRERTGHSLFVAETHTTYRRELLAGEGVSVRTRFLGVDAKRLHVFQTMTHEVSGEISATQEGLALHVDLRTRRAAAWQADRLARLRAVISEEADQPPPDAAGRRIAMPK